jgi:hypothetical protein
MPSPWVIPFLDAFSIAMLNFMNYTSFHPRIRPSERERELRTFSDYRLLSLSQHIKGTNPLWTMRACGKIVRSYHFLYTMLVLWLFPVILSTNEHHLTDDAPLAASMWYVAISAIWSVCLPCLLMVCPRITIRAGDGLIKLSLETLVQQQFMTLLYFGKVRIRQPDLPAWLRYGTIAFMIFPFFVVFIFH